jgi:hypothetical protein
MTFNFSTSAGIFGEHVPFYGFQYTSLSFTVQPFSPDFSGNRSHDIGNPKFISDRMDYDNLFNKTGAISKKTPETSENVETPLLKFPLDKIRF